MTDSTDNKPVKKIIKRATLPPKELIKGLPKNADIAANSSGGISVHYRYRSPEARKLSGGKAVLHLGTVQELIFRPTTNYLLHPEQYPIPEKQLKGRRVTMMRQTNVLPESAEQNAKSEIREQPLEDEPKPCPCRLVPCSPCSTPASRKASSRRSSWLLPAHSAPCK